MFQALVLNAPNHYAKYLLSAASLLSKQQSQAADINKYYGLSAPNPLLAAKTMTQNKIVISTVLFCHFLASFTALGMPLFLPKLMQDLLSQDMNMLIGWYYILPTICTALAAPWWGRFADRYGKRLSLLRAQLGLALGFMIVGFA